MFHRGSIFLGPKNVLPSTSIVKMFSLDSNVNIDSQSTPPPTKYAQMPFNHRYVFLSILPRFPFSSTFLLPRFLFQLVIFSPINAIRSKEFPIYRPPAVPLQCGFFYKETNGDATLRFLTAQPTTLPRIEKKKNGICSVSQQHFNT